MVAMCLEERNGVDSRKNSTVFDGCDAASTDTCMPHIRPADKPKTTL